MQDKYILVSFPDIQLFMHHPRWSECYLLQANEDQQYIDSSYFVPQDLYNEVTGLTPTIYVVIDINLQVAEDTVISCAFATKEKAFDYAIGDVKKVNGRDIKIHNYQIEGYPSVPTRISNNRSLGSEYGITYKSYYGSYLCARMIVERKLR